MRKLTLTADQFNTFVFPQMANSQVGTDGEWETALRVLRKLKDPALTTEVPLTDDEQKLKASGQSVYAFRKLTEAKATFILEEDEWRFIRERIDAHKTRVAIVVIEDFEELLRTIREAEVFEVKSESASPAAQQLEHRG